MHNSNVRDKNLLPLVKEIISKKNSFFDLVDRHKTPFYVYDQEGIDKSIKRFTEAFNAHIPNFQPYYAIKLNHHPFLIDF